MKHRAKPLLDDRPEAQALLSNLKAKLPELETLLERIGDNGRSEDSIYRFYHMSFKVYALQKDTEEIVTALRSLAPERPLNELFSKIVAEGTGKRWTLEHNKRWTEETRPIVEAFFHSLYFLKIAIRYGGSLAKPPALLPSGWAALLHLYDLR